MATYVILGGMTTGGWWMKQLATRLRKANHDVYTPTYTGLGERSHLLQPNINLNTHIDDALGVLKYEDLDEVILVGKSYSGAVISGVADKVPERIKHLVYVDAIVPRDGQSVADIVGEDVMSGVLESVEVHGDGWLIPANTTVDPRLTPHPFKTLLQPLTLKNPRAESIPRTFIFCSKKKPANAWMDRYLGRFARDAQAQGWHYRELPTDHEPERDMPDELALLLLEIVST